jgi:hypothetical protein
MQYLSTVLLAIAVVSASAETDVCTDCQIIASFVSQSSADKQQLTRVTDLLNLVCDRLTSGDPHSSCTNIANNVPFIVSKMETLFNNPAAMCAEAGLCQREQPVHVKVAHAVKVMATFVHGSEKRNRHPFECGLCDFVLEALSDLVDIPALQNETTTVLDSVCQDLRKNSTIESCQELVGTYVSKFFDVLDKLLSNGKATCARLNMCKGDKMQLFDAEAVVAMIAGDIAEIDTVEATQPATRFVQAMTADSRKSGMMACTFCKIGATGIITYYGDDTGAMPALANNVKDTVCNNVLPKAYQPDCLDFLGLYLEPVMIMTLKQVNPDMVCDILKLCKKGQL